MRNDVLLILLISSAVFIAGLVYNVKRLKKMTYEEREKETDRSLDRAGWLTIIKNILKLFTN